MKRKEEINIAAKNKYPYIKGLPQTLSHQAIFIEGAEWADKTMLDFVCEFFEPRLHARIGREDTEELIAEFMQMKGCIE